MDLNTFIEKFFQNKMEKAQDLNILLDYARRSYIHNEITAQQYRTIIKQLEQLGATSPTNDYSFQVSDSI